MSTTDRINKAGDDGQLLESTVTNLLAWREGGFLPSWALASIDELVKDEQWSELDDRFYKNMEFGTGGMRGRTIGAVTTAAERDGAVGAPRYPAVGSNLLNDLNVIRATVGLYRYAEAYLAGIHRYDRPRLVIAHDVRHFSRHFCELAASAWTRLGGLAFIFAGPRSTPQLSFSVRYLKATAGVVITASHNPPHDNGYKVYFEDGAQIVEPHASGIIEEVGRFDLRNAVPYLEVDTEGVVTLPAEVDEAYRKSVAATVISPEVFGASDLKAVYSPIHGTGSVQTVPLMEEFGLRCITVADQMEPDPDFTTVKSPNPENSEALAMALDKAEETGADLVLATDPDADRMGVAVRDRDNSMQLLSGNQIGAVLAEYRIRRLKETGVLPPEGTFSAALIKTFVTSPLQEAIARRHGLKVIDTLTGFKWIGEKISRYEKALRAAMLEKEGIALDYDATPLASRQALLIKHSTLYVFGGEESYGFLASDEVRDKDANSAVLMFCELAASLKKEGRTIPEYLDDLYIEYGYHAELLGQIYYEGAVGARKIGRILESYRSAPPEEIDGTRVAKFTDFGNEEVWDVDGQRIPPQDFYFLELEDGYSCAVRGSGTEPKIKFYLFAKGERGVGREDLPQEKERVGGNLRKLREAIEKDAVQRAEREG